MITLKLIDFTDDFYSGVGSLKIGKEIDRLILENPYQTIFVSMEGVQSISPSFINGAFLYIIDLYGYDYFKTHIRITNILMRLLPSIKEAIDFHVQKKNTFFQSLNTNTIFVGIDGSKESMKIRKQIFDGVQKQVTFFSNTNKDNIFDEETKQKIQLATAFIGIWTAQTYEKNILAQANYAISLRKPCIIFCNQKVYVKVPDETKSMVQLLRFDDNNLLLQQRNLNDIILQNQISTPKSVTIDNPKPKGSNNINEMLAWGALGVLGVIVLASLISDE